MIRFIFIDFNVISSDFKPSSWRFEIDDWSLDWLDFTWFLMISRDCLRLLSWFRTKWFNDFTSDWPLELSQNLWLIQVKKNSKCTRREFLREILYKNIAIIAIQYSKMYFVETFGNFPILLNEIHSSPSGKIPYTY